MSWSNHFTWLSNPDSNPDWDAFYTELHKHLWGKSETWDQMIYTEDITIPYLNEVPDEFKDHDTLAWTWAPELMPTQTFRYLDTSRVVTAGMAIKLLIREEYTIATEHARQPQTLDADHTVPTGMILCGQPGIGKSAYLKYCLIQWLTQGLTTIYAPTKETWYLFISRGVYRFNSDQYANIFRHLVRIHGGNENIIKEFREALRTGWLLFDFPDTPEVDSGRFIGWKCINATSPVFRRFRYFKNHWHAKVFIMQPWSWEEIVAGHLIQSAKPTLEECLQAFLRFGPSARVVYKTGQDPLYSQTVDSTIMSIEPSRLFTVGWTEGFGSTVVVVRPMRLSNGAIQRSVMSSHTASKYIAELIIRNANERVTSDLREGFNDIVRSEYAKSAAQALFEPAVHRCLERRGASNYAVQSLDLPGQSTISLSIETVCFLGDIAEISNRTANEYLRTKHKNIAGVNSLVCTDPPTFFYFTVSSDCDIKAKDLESLKDVLQAPTATNAWRLVFVVPKGLTFNKQSVLPSPEEPKWTCKIKQYVLELSNEELWQTNRGEHFDSSTVR